MQIIEVISRKTKKEFLKVPKLLYKNDPNWICPLDNDIESIFNPGKNPYYKEGDAIRWILKNDKGKLIGRIAAFYNKKRAYAFDQPTGGIGFFECINNKDAAFILFDHAKEWLKLKGMEAMDGPINFGENQNNWGLLVDGFVQQGMGIPYNFPYYREFFESYGFKNFFEQYTYHRYIPDEFPPRIQRILNWVMTRSNFEYKHFKFSEKEKFISDLVEIYNNTWVKLKGDFTPMDYDDVLDAYVKAKAVIDEELIWFVYKDNKPISFFVFIPDINMILRHLNGKLNIIGVIKFLYYKKKKEMTRMRGIIGGTIPQFQNTGVETGVFKKLFDVLQNKHYTEIELSWVGDFNPKMEMMFESIGGIRAKTHITYRYLFDPNKPFVRFKDIPATEEK